MRLKENSFYGRLNDPTCSAFYEGVCGDTMEFYLVIKDQKLVDVKFWTSGCESSRACGNVLSNYVLDKNIYQALKISPGYILDHINDLPEEYHHCAVLACITFYKAAGEFLVSY